MIKVSKMFGGTHGSRALAWAIATGLALASSTTLAAGVGGRGGGRGRVGGAPPNNTCIDAIEIVEGDPPVPFSTIGATTDGPGDCATRQDIWYRYVAQSVKQVTVSLCDSDYDTHLSVYDGGTCPPTVLLDCNDDSSACTSPVRPQVVFLSVAGVEYPIRVGGFFASPGTGTMTVTAIDTPGINDECAQALEIFDGTKHISTVNTTDSKPGLPPSCGAENGTIAFGADIWYTYIATCNGTLTVNQCDINFDGRMALYWGHNCPPDDADLAGCNDDACGLGEGPIVTVNVTCGDLLTLRVGGWGGDFGAGILVLTCDGGPCLPCPWDLDGNGGVQLAALQTLIDQWGTNPGGPPDFDDDGVVAVPDLLALLAHWGPCP